MGTTDTFHLSWPDLDAAADGPDALEDVAKDAEAGMRGARPRKVLLLEAAVPTTLDLERSPGTTASLWSEQLIMPASGAYWVEVELYLPIYQPVTDSPVAGWLTLKIANVIARRVRYHSQAMVPIVLPVQFSGASAFGFTPGQRVTVGIDISVDSVSAPIRWTDGSVAVWAVAPNAAP